MCVQIDPPGRCQDSATAAGLGQVGPDRAECRNVARRECGFFQG